ncbi:SDR family oxidoreductase [Enterococcus sp. LJL90]
MILITSAAGNTGRSIATHLIAAGFDVAVTDINPQVAEIPGIKKSFVGDLTSLAFINQIMSSVDQVVYIPPLFSAEETLIGKQMIDSAIDHQVNQFVFISVTHPILSTLLQHIAKRDVEEHLIYRGMETQFPYTILQPMHYMHNFNPAIVEQTGEYRIFYGSDSKVAYVDTTDVAEVLADVLSNVEKHNKATYELVGTQPYSPNELVDMFNQVYNKKAQAIFLPVEDFLDQINATDLYFRKGFEQLADSYTTWGLDGNSNVLEFLLGRKPTSFEDYLRAQQK